MYTITKQFSFEAAHYLKGLPEDHKCSRLHGHSYRVEVVLQSSVLNLKTGFVVDYGDLDVIGLWIKQTLDHRNLNEVMPLNQTSAENICYIIFQQWIRLFPQLVAVRVSETAKTWAEFRP